MNKDITLCYPAYPCKDCNQCKIFIGNVTKYKNYKLVDYSILIGFSKKCKFMKGEN